MTLWPMAVLDVVAVKKQGSQRNERLLQEKAAEGSRAAIGTKKDNKF